MTTLEAGPGLPVRAGRTVRRRLGLFSAITIMAASNVVSNRVWPEAYIPWNLAVAAILLVLARRCGVTWGDLGLGSARLRRALLHGGLAAAAVGLIYLVAVTLPATRPAFLDARAAGPLSSVLFAALVRIPLGTVVLEETAFRGVLPALVGGGWWRGTLVSSALFGLWHVLPSMGMSSANAAVGEYVGGWGTVAQVALAVLGTFAAGVLLCAWRRWGGHLVTPMLAHLATNSLGVLVAWWMITP
ncbi:CPBP family intramembrane glutamic endopeptidase [Pseudonocardia acidicola]|uniref:CPBP family intramembrane metalloprotease n=1 Tax=Pseudonocardia acidicola TaxID=2724939 RepID=A0ABX1SGM4_9PSEU|nr:CPBP family intramembrane glutamic endopeptidase [Pseudonocardia acidicola]NMI00216.1 CPBP family intramembrane metalloprotease [Pseudonocardia acidicola]